MKILDRFMHRWHIKVFSFLLALILFWFHRVSTLDERFFSVPLDVVMGGEFIPSQDYPSHVSITLRGTSEDIYSVVEEDFVARADFSGNETEGKFREPVVIEKKGTALLYPNVEVRVEPGDVVISQESKITRTLPVDPTLTGFPSLGYDLSQYFVSPSSVTVIGPRSVLEDLESLSTETIDLSGKYEDFNVSSRLKYPSESVYFPGGDVIEFRGVITEALLVKTVANIDVTLLNLSSALRLSESPPRGSVTVQGNQGQIESLDRGGVLLFADCGHITRPGRYTIPVLPRMTGDAALLNWLPREITIELTGE